MTTHTDDRPLAHLVCLDRSFRRVAAREPRLGMRQGRLRPRIQATSERFSRRRTLMATGRPLHLVTEAVGGEDQAQHRPLERARVQPAPRRRHARHQRHAHKASHHKHAQDARTQRNTHPAFLRRSTGPRSAARIVTSPPSRSSSSPLPHLITSLQMSAICHVAAAPKYISQLMSATRVLVPSRAASVENGPRF